MKVMSLVFGVMFLVGCATAEVGKKFNTDNIHQVQVGKTTESEVIALLGQPIAIKESSDGTKIYGYVHGKGTARFGSITSTADKVKIQFNKHGVVESISKGSVGK
jgi:outer membrane protein assembly factor BamE (lipoprotein component of BamABCDE complex)